MKINLKLCMLAFSMICANCFHPAMADQAPNASGHLYLQKANDSTECVLPLNEPARWVRTKLKDNLGPCTFNSIGAMKFDQAASAVTIELRSGVIIKNPDYNGGEWRAACLGSSPPWSTFNAVLKTSKNPTTTEWFTIYDVLRTNVGDLVAPNVRVMSKSLGPLPPNNEVYYYQELFACIIATPSD